MYSTLSQTFCYRMHGHRMPKLCNAFIYNRYTAVGEELGLTAPPHFTITVIERVLLLWESVCLQMLTLLQIIVALVNVSQFSCTMALKASGTLRLFGSLKHFCIMLRFRC